MAKCIKCGRKGLFLKVNINGLCDDCANLPKQTIFDIFKQFETDITELYKFRENPGILDQVIQLCQRQIVLSLLLFDYFSELRKQYEHEKAELGYLGELDEDAEAGRLLDKIPDMAEGAMNDPLFENKIAKIKRVQELSRLHHRAEGTGHIRHKGFTTLCIIREKEGNWSEVLRVAEQAKSEGWYADTPWDKRIEKAKKKLNKN